MGAPYHLCRGCNFGFLRDSDGSCPVCGPTAMSTASNAEIAEQIALRVFVRSLAEPPTVGILRDVAREVLDAADEEPIIGPDGRPFELAPRRRL